MRVKMVPLGIWTHVSRAAPDWDLSDALPTELPRRLSLFMTLHLTLFFLSVFKLLKTETVEQQFVLKSQKTLVQEYRPKRTRTAKKIPSLHCGNSHKSTKVSNKRPRSWKYCAAHCTVNMLKDHNIQKPRLKKFTSETMISNYLKICSGFSREKVAYSACCICGLQHIWK